MTWERYAQIDHPVPYVLRLGDPRGGQLLYFGSRHTFDPDHPQVDQIMDLWHELQPTLAFYEGGGPAAPPGDTMEEAVRRGAEPGLVRYLAQRDSVRAVSPEPDQTLDVAHLSRHYSAEQIKLFYVLRQVSQYVSYSERDLGAPLEERVAEALEAIGSYPGLGGRPRDLAELDTVCHELLSATTGWRDITLEFFRPNPGEPKRFTNRISAELGDLRDAHIAERIIRAVEAGERLFVVMGSSHPVRQEGILRQALSSRDLALLDRVAPLSPS